MANLALYRKYRPLKLSDVVGQEHISKTLANSLKKGSISHAYLFTGPHGVGKTSVARILAHEANGLKYDESSHLDIIEIDAASNRRIDEIRDLRDKIHIAPSSSKYKVYIIDEVHMLTKEAFNALLKTLEEPPKHALFILATTDAHKLPETIISRTQRFAFRPISPEILALHLKKISKKESINIDDDAIELLSKHSGGSARDAIALLEQMDRTEGKISPSAVREHLGLAPQEYIHDLSSATIGGDIGAIVNLLKASKTHGVDPTSLSYQLIEHLRAKPDRTSLELIEQLLKIPGSHYPDILLETTLLKAALPSGIDLSKPKQDSKPDPKQPEENEAEITKQNGHAKETRQPSSPISNTSQLDMKAWRDLLKKVKDVNNSLYAILRMAQPSMDSDRKILVLEFKFPFHQKRLTEERNKRQTEELAKEAFGNVSKIESRHNPNSQISSEVYVRSGVAPEVEGVIDVMGGGEVVDI